MGIARALVLIGALNWGLVGLFRFDLVGALFGGPASFLARVVYAIIGISAVIMLVGAATGNRQRNQVS